MDKGPEIPAGDMSGRRKGSRLSKYHLTRVDREIGEESELEDLLTSGRLAAVALCMENEPYVVTMNYGYDPEGQALYFHCANKGHKLEFIRANDRACATIVSDLGYVDGKCEHKYRSLVIRGRICEVVELDEKKHGIETLMIHQESDPDPVRSRNFKSDSDYDGFSILKIEIEDIKGKQSL